jgi:hypothetical protein
LSFVGFLSKGIHPYEIAMKPLIILRRYSEGASTHLEFRLATDFTIAPRFARPRSPKICQNVPLPSCFLTDSSGLLLADCAGAPVTASGSSDGRFIIVVNKKNIEVATNPGQFYYNFIWRNAGVVPQTVSVAFSRLGVAPQGAQALHSWVTHRFGGPITTSEFDATNEIGLPSGSDDNVGPVSVPPGDSLIVTYHLEWTGIGGQAPSTCATSCATANQIISVTGTVSGPYITTQTCTAEARGYKK